MLQNKSSSVISSSIWQYFPRNVNSCNIDKVHLKRKNKTQHERNCRPGAADGGTGVLWDTGSVKEFFQELRWEQQLDPSGPILLEERPETQVQMHSSHQAEGTHTLLPAELHPMYTKNVQSWCCHGMWICPSYTEI